MEESNEIKSDHRSNMTDGILMLNDDCFLHIFKYLPLINLSNFKEAYVSVAAVADTEFCRRTRGSLDFRTFSCDEQIKKLKQITKQFGTSVVRLDIRKYSSQTKWSEIFSAIGEHCTEKLKSLSLHGCSIEKADVLLIAGVLKNIETLRVTVRLDTYRHLDTKECFTILSLSENVRSLKIFCDDIKLPETIFRKNESLLVLNIQGVIKISELERVVDNLVKTRLEELRCMINTINAKAANLSALLRLNHLKRLFIHCIEGDVDSFLQKVNAFTSLNVLSLRNVTLNETSFVTFGRITRLKVLQLVECGIPRTSSYFKSLLVLCGNKNFELISFLYYDNLPTIEKVNFLQLVEKRKASGAVKCLDLFFGSDESTKSIPLELLEANKETIRLINRCDRNGQYRISSEP